MHEEKRRTNVHRKQVVEIFDRGLLDGHRLRDPRIGNENVEAISDDCANLLGERVWSARFSQVNPNLLGLAACTVYFDNDRGGLFAAAAVVDHHLSAG